MQNNKKIFIDVPNPDEKGFGIERKFTRLEWQAECFRMLSLGSQVFNQWQQDLLSTLNNQKDTTKYYTWHLYYPNKKNEKEIITIPCSLMLDFSNCVFNEELNLDGYKFIFDSWFGGVTFNEAVSFLSARFNNKSIFRGT